MATTVARLEAVLSANTRDFDRGMQKSESTMGKVGKTAGVVGVAIGTGLALAARAGFKEFIEGEKVTAQTNAVLKSTGGAAKVTTKEVEKLAMALSKKSGVDDEQIQTGQNMLLTFKKIQNQTGKNRDYFDQATKATLDLSVAMGKDMQSSAILVGKALNDPVKGLTALARVGVQFDNVQKELIKDLVEGKSAADNITETYQGNLSVAQLDQIKKMDKLHFSWREIAKAINIDFTPAQINAMNWWERGGHMAQAQTTILKELNSEFGGSAEAAGKTFAGQLNILKNAFAELMAMIVGGVMPALLSLVKHMQTAVTWLQENQKAAKILFVALGILAGAMIAARAAQLLLNLAILANPYVAVAALIATFGLAMVVAYQRSDTFKEKVNNLWAALRNNPLVELAGLIADLSAKLSGAQTRTEGLKRWTEVLWETMKQSQVGTFVRGLMAIAEAVEEIVKWIRKLIKGIEWLAEHAGGVFGAVGGAVGAVAGKLPNPFGEGGPGGAGAVGGIGGGGQLPGGLINAANSIDSRHMPYLWGGGHSAGTMGGPYDCSGAVSALLRAGGLMSGSMVSGEFMNYGEPGMGRALTILANPEHVYALINGRAWGTSGQNPGGGAGWFSGGVRPGFAIRHPAGFDRGGVVPYTGLIYAHKGETVLPTHRGGSTNVFNFPNYVGSKNELIAAIQNAAAEFKRRNGRPLV